MVEINFRMGLTPRLFNRDGSQSEEQSVRLLAADETLADHAIAQMHLPVDVFDVLDAQATVVRADHHFEQL